MLFVERRIVPNCGANDRTGALLSVAFSFSKSHRNSAKLNDGSRPLAARHWVIKPVVINELLNTNVSVSAVTFVFRVPSAPITHPLEMYSKANI